MSEKEPKLDLPKGFILDDSDPDMPKVIHTVKDCPSPEMAFSKVVTVIVINKAINDHNLNLHKQ